MKKTLFVALISATMLVFSNVAFADDAIEDGSMNFEFRNFNPSLTFKAQVSGDASATDFKNDLGLADKKSNEFRLNLGRTLRLAYTKFSYGGSGNPTVGSVTYDGQSFEVTAPVTTDININYYRLSWLIPITTSDEMTTKWIIDLKAFKFDTRLAGTDPSTSNPVTVQKSFQGGIPTVGFATSFRLASNLTAYGEITGLPLGKYGHFYDMEGGLKYEIGEFAIGAGYRNFDLNIKDGSTNGDNVQLKLAGPYYNVSYKF
ncbi:MAG: hypothetical protein H6Q73_458 [Firmicutes bacterium]|nr:hypothetical protein [Bacillota bacterium]